jgi:hypothetical protein
MAQPADRVMESEEQRADGRDVHQPDAGHHAVGGALAFDLDEGAAAGGVPNVVWLGDDPVDAAALEARQPARRDARVPGGRRHTDAAGDAVQDAYQAVAALDERTAAEILVPVGEQVERDVGRWRLPAQAIDPRRRRVQAIHQDRELERDIGREDDLTVEDEVPAVGGGEQGFDDFGKYRASGRSCRLRRSTSRAWTKARQRKPSHFGSYV